MSSPVSDCEHVPDFPQAPSLSPFGTAACTLAINVMKILAINVMKTLAINVMKTLAINVVKTLAINVMKIFAGNVYLVFLSLLVCSSTSWDKHYTKYILNP